MISIDELADFTLRANSTIEALKRRIQELETENKILKETLARQAPKE
jgi:hypothetical protein